MKRLLLILILTLSFQSWAKAADINDLEIEGISIGDSLLNFVSLEYINNDIEYIYPDDGYWGVFIPEYKLEQYDTVTVLGKKNDKNFIIESITGDLFHDNVEECLKKKNEIVKNIKKNFLPISIFDQEPKKHSGDNKTTTHTTFLTYNNGKVLIACYDWSKESGFPPTSKVSLSSTKFLYWLDNKAFD